MIGTIPAKPLLYSWISVSLIGPVFFVRFDGNTGRNPFVPDVDRAAKLRQLANDPKGKRSDRARAVCALFREYIKPGDGLQEVRRALGDAAWLEEARLSYFAYVSGSIPIDFKFEDRTYSLHLFADNDGHSEWVIYFQLSGKSDWAKYNKDAIAFLRGKPGPKVETRIKEFALCHPDGEYEIFRGK